MLFRPVLLVCALCVSGPALAADSDEDVSRQLFADILAPVADAARSADATGIAVRGKPAKDGPQQSFFDEVGDRLLSDGFAVWLLPSGATVPAGALALDVELTTSEIDYPTQTRQFLGIGRARIQRRVALGARFRLSDPVGGRLLYHAEPVRVQREWMSYSEANQNAERRPDWMGAESIQDIQQRNPWWQRTLVVGIVAGVAILYFGGAS